MSMSSDRIPSVKTAPKAHRSLTKESHRRGRRAIAVKERYELAGKLRNRYAAAGRPERSEILNGFCLATGYGRKFAIRVLRERERKPARLRRPRRRQNGLAFQQDQAPTLVPWTGNPLLPREHSQYLADTIPGARLAEISGSISHPTMRDMDALADAVEEFVSGARGSVSIDRMLTTVLFTDIVGSTQRLTQVGDRQWKEMLDVHDRLAEQQIARFRGRLIDRTGDGLIATFDGPARAIRCGLALRVSWTRLWSCPAPVPVY